MKKTLLVTGGCGFIGSNLVLEALRRGKWRIINIDKLTYSANPASLADIENHPDYQFFRADIRDAEAIRNALETYAPDAIINLAAESHVDRSIDGPCEFIDTNIVGTFVVLEEARRYWKKLSGNNPVRAEKFRFHHVSTDEVFGDLTKDGRDNLYFNEKTPYDPGSPYSASKAASDFLVRAWHNTYGLPILITNCSNNYGPRQFPEKLIPLTILNAIHGKPISVYGEGLQIRDWLHVDDHVDGLFAVLERGEPGETYAIGANNEKTNIEVVKNICTILEKLGIRRPDGKTTFHDLITFVADRPGHDGRYAIDATKLRTQLGWKPVHDFEDGLQQTVKWYLNNGEWWTDILTGRYQGQRLGLNT